MTIAQKLRDTAEKIISDAETKSKNLENNPPSHKAPIDQLKAYNAECEAAAQALSRIHGRLPYVVRRSAPSLYNCPRCWFLGPSLIHSLIEPYPGQSLTKNDLWRCETCGHEEIVVRGI